MFLPKQTIGVLVALLLFPSVTLPQNVDFGSDADKEVVVLPKVVVKANRIAPTTGTTIIDKEMIEELPSRNGSINEIIGIVPGIQYNEDALHSFTAGEITPLNISVSGSRFYDNNFTIDGISNNSTFDSILTIVNDASRLPGHPQKLILDPHLIEQITVYDSNIPAEFGSFTGGQIEAKTLDPADYFWGNVNYRTTRSSWTNFYIAPADEEAFYHSNSETFQPRFQKQDGGFTINTPLTEDIAITTSYQQLFSKIDLKHLGGDKEQTRQQENLFIKFGYQPTSSMRLFFTALYAPTNSKFFLKDFRNSDLQLKDEGYLFSLKSEKETTVGLFDLTLAYNTKEKKRASAKDRFFWNATTASIDWSTGKEGGLGDLEAEEKVLSLKATLSFDSQKLGATEHLIKLGAEITNTQQSSNRPETSYYYNSPVLFSTTPFVCANGDPACIENEQYLSRRTVYNKAAAEAEVNNYAIFLQDAMVWGKVEVFPGFRFSQNDLNNDVNIAPRLSASLDLFGNQDTVFFVGKNRYFSGTLLSRKITSETYQVENQVRATAANDEASWSSTTPQFFIDSDLKTPYTDEITLGAIQKVFAGELKIQYLNKKSRDEIATTRESGPFRYTLNNNGRSEHESLQASWQRSWPRHSFEINATWQETTTSNVDYGDRFDDSNTSATIWYEGEELYYEELPRIDYNRPLVANLIYIGRLSENLTFSNTTKYRAAYWRLRNTGSKQTSVKDPSQESWVYEIQKNKSSILFDWRISWQVPTFADNNAILTLDIYNVFDRRFPVRYYTDELELGRQYWAGIEFNF